MYKFVAAHCFVNGKLVSVDIESIKTLSIEKYLKFYKFSYFELISFGDTLSKFYNANKLLENIVNNYPVIDRDACIYDIITKLSIDQLIEPETEIITAIHEFEITTTTQDFNNISKLENDHIYFLNNLLYDQPLMNNSKEISFNRLGKTTFNHFKKEDITIISNSLVDGFKIKLDITNTNINNNIVANNGIFLCLFGLFLPITSSEIFRPTITYDEAVGRKYITLFVTYWNLVYLLGVLKYIINFNIITRTIKLQDLSKFYKWIMAEDSGKNKFNDLVSVDSEVLINAMLAGNTFLGLIDSPTKIEYKYYDVTETNIFSSQYRNTVDLLLKKLRITGFIELFDKYNQNDTTINSGANISKEKNSNVYLRLYDDLIGDHAFNSIYHVLTRDLAIYRLDTRTV